MEKKVAIVGIGRTSCKAPRREVSHMELLYEATRRALEDASLTRDDIGTAFTTSYDFLEGRSLSNQYTVDSIGGVMKPSDLRLAEDGIYGLIAGYMEVATNPRDIVVVGSVQKASERDESRHAFQKVILASLDPIYVRPLSSRFPEGFPYEYLLASFEERRYFHLYGISEEHVAKVVVKNRRNALDNPLAANPGEISLDEVMGSPALCPPLKELEVAPKVDAACALVLASAERARGITDKPVWIGGIGWASESGVIGRHELGKAESTRLAAKRAYHMAGIKAPRKEIQVAEISDWYGYKELQHYEALGFCPEGGGGRFIDDGVPMRGGDLPVNPSGGLLGEGNSVGTSGLIRVAQAALQLRGEAGACQVPNPDVALAQSWGGPGTRVSGVVVLFI
jgi:acetyl-CoA C-acetyltransferase